jgi:hypothetical protein
LILVATFLVGCDWVLATFTHDGAVDEEVSGESGEEFFGSILPFDVAGLMILVRMWILEGDERNVQSYT